MILNCPTSKAILLCAVDDTRGVLRCPVHGGDFPGLVFNVTPLTPINPQLMALASSFFARDITRHLDIEQSFADPIIQRGQEIAELTLYLARLSPAAGMVAPPEWPSIPDILRSLEGRLRIPYLRAWQILAGGLQLNTKAVDAAEVAKYFED